MLKIIFKVVAVSALFTVVYFAMHLYGGNRTVTFFSQPDHEASGDNKLPFDTKGGVQPVQPESIEGPGPTQGNTSTPAATELLDGATGTL